MLARTMLVIWWASDVEGVCVLIFFLSIRFWAKIIFFRHRFDEIGGLCFSSKPLFQQKISSIDMLSMTMDGIFLNSVHFQSAHDEITSAWIRIKSDHSDSIISVMNLPVHKPQKFTIPNAIQLFAIRNYKSLCQHHDYRHPHHHHHELTWTNKYNRRGTREIYTHTHTRV